jgi:fucose 4-O-acetylase-like acetyltransferase
VQRLRRRASHSDAPVRAETSPARLSQAQSRSLYAMRGLAALIVVIAHVTDWPTRGLFFSMPLFFFLAGYLYSQPRDYGTYLVSLARKLLLPYAIFLTAISLPATLETFASEGIGAGMARLGWLAMGGEQIKGVYAAFWYPTCFFFAHAGYSLARRYLGAGAMHLLSALLLTLATLNGLMADVWLPLATNVAAMAFPIIHLGYVYRHRGLSGQADRVFHLLIGSFGLLYGAAAAFYLVPGLGMKIADYGWPLVTPAAGVAMVILVKQLFDRLQASWLVNATLGQIGPASLIIMFLHQPVQMWLVSVLDIHHELFRIAMGCAIPFVFFECARRTAIGRWWLLGKPR